MAKKEITVYHKFVRDSHRVKGPQMALNSTMGPGAAFLGSTKRVREFFLVDPAGSPYQVPEELYNRTKIGDTATVSVPDAQETGSYPRPSDGSTLANFIIVSLLVFSVIFAVLIAT